MMSRRGDIFVLTALQLAREPEKTQSHRALSITRPYNVGPVTTPSPFPPSFVPTMKPRRKVAFTEEDDALLMKYIATYNTQPRGRLGVKLYDKLIENVRATLYV